MAPDSVAGQSPIARVDLNDTDAPLSLARALRATGFAQLTGHGLDADVRTKYRSVCDAFFDLPLATKNTFVHPSPAANRGYRARGSEALSYSLGKASPPDLFESFNAGVDPAPDHDHPLIQPTPWPDSVVPEFAEAAGAMFGEFSQLASRLDAMLASVLGIEWLRSRSTCGPDMLAAINYRPDESGHEAAVAGQQRMGAHSDYTTFTVLDADPVPGLQIVDAKGGWVDVIPDPGAVLLNVGDVLAMLTNDAWPSTLHRVVPMAEGAAPHRRSVAFFHYPDLDVEIVPIEAFVDDQPHYSPVTVEEHLLAKLVSPKVHEASSAASTAAGRLDG